ncbi:MAG: DUF402 domain-containing protein [Promethearchaeota archaeon]
MTSPSVKIRGIYSTSLTKVFLDAGFTVVDPSPVIEGRFPKADFSSGEPDLLVEDRYDREGVVVTYRDPELSPSDLPLNFRNYWDVVSFQAHVLKDAIYQAEVIKNDFKRKTSLVLLEEGNDRSQNPLVSRPVAIIDGVIDRGTRLMVQVEQPSYLIRKAKVSENVTISNDLLVLLLDSRRVLVSRKIQDQHTRARLKKVGREAQVPYGIIFRTASVEQLEEDPDVLTQQILEMKREMDAIARAGADDGDIGLVREGVKTQDLIFSRGVKYSLDATRRDIVPTIKEHHRLKAGARDRQQDGYKRAVDFCEKLMSQFPEKAADIEGQFRETFSDVLRPGDTLRIEHQKLDGRKFFLTPGVIQKIDLEAGKLEVFRRLNAGGVLDGLDIPKEYGDTAISKFDFNEWFVETTYFNERGEVKGKYFNVNTPPELTFNSVHYVDLEVDVVERGSDREVIDKEKLENAYLLGTISEKMYKKAKTVAKNLATKEGTQ